MQATFPAKALASHARGRVCRREGNGRRWEEETAARLDQSWAVLKRTFQPDRLWE